MRWLVAFVLVLGLSGRADAKAMIHLDLAGLVLASEAIVVADRIGVAPDPDRTRFRITRVIRGGLKVGAYVDVHDQMYDTAGRPIDTRAVLFLQLFRGKPHLVSSGLRVIERGKVFRFEQRENPGPFSMVQQGSDPEDNWRASTEQLDLPGLERAIAAAVARVDALGSAIRRSAARPSSR